MSEVSFNFLGRRPSIGAAYLAALLVIILFGPACGLRAADTESIDDHIANVENRLILLGNPSGTQRTATLAQGMRFLRVPAVSVAVIDNYQIEWARAWGTREAGSAKAVNIDTLFQAGSISKPVAAMGVMHLVQEGKLSLDANVNDVLKSWKVPDNQFTRQKPVTLRELLTHGAGTNIHGFIGYNVGIERPSVLQVLEGVPPANTPPVTVEAVPGSEWRYSGGGYEIINQMVLDVTGVPFDEFMRATVLQPLGMNHSTYQQPLPLAMQENAASGTRDAGIEVVGKWRVYPEQAAAGLWTTPSDVARFAIALMNTERGLGNPVVSASTGQAMLTPQRETSDGSGAQQGLGIFLEGSKAFFHAGINEGFQAYLLAYDAGYGVVVMANSDNGLQLAKEIVATIQREYGWSPL